MGKMGNAHHRPTGLPVRASLSWTRTTRVRNARRLARGVFWQLTGRCTIHTGQWARAMGRGPSSWLPATEPTIAREMLKQGFWLCMPRLCMYDRQGKAALNIKSMIAAFKSHQIQPSKHAVAPRHRAERILANAPGIPLFFFGYTSRTVNYDRLQQNNNKKVLLIVDLHEVNSVVTGSNELARQRTTAFCCPKRR